MGNLGSAVDELLAVDVSGLPDTVLMDEVVDLYRQVNRLHAAALERLEQVDRRGAALVDHASTAGWLRDACRLTPGRAHGDVRLARELADVAPVTFAALADGDITVAHAQVITSARRDIGDTAMAAADPHLADAARRLRPDELRGFVTHVRHSYRPDKVADEERDLYDERGLSFATTLGGLSLGRWECDPASQEIIATAIHALSKPTPGDDRTARQRRIDALVTLCENALRGGTLPDSGGVKPHVSVLVDLDTIEQRAGSRAADLSFGGTLSGDGLRRFLCDADISRIVIGPTGEILDAGRATRTFTAAQRRAIVARDRHCIWAGCDAPPGWCDAHHIVHWTNGGETSVENGVLLCGRHHDRVHHHRHAIVKHADGRFTVDLRPDSDTDNPPPGGRDGPEEPRVWPSTRDGPDP